MKNMRFVRDSGPYKAGEIHSLDDQAALDAFTAGDACNTEEAPNASLQPVVEFRGDAGEDERVFAEEGLAEQVETEHSATERDAPETAAAAAAPETK